MEKDPVFGEIIAEFRSTAVERLAQIEAAWHQLSAAPDAALGVEIEREVHNLKGDARLVGFHDVTMLCHKLEDMLRFGRSRSYRIPDTIDLLVAALVGFMRLLVQKQAGQPMAGLDLAEFATQVDDALREAYLAPATAEVESLTSRPANATSQFGAIPIGRVSQAAISRLASAATTVYVQHLIAEGASRAPLRRAWTALAREIRDMRALPLSTVLSRHPAAARDLAQSHGKQVEVNLSVGEVTIGPTFAAVLDVAVTHAVTNAVDHGIESPAARREARKSPTGQISLMAATHGDEVEVTIADDGRGVDLAAVRRRALECGLLRPEQAERASECDLLQMLMQPSFSTKRTASTTSGRGVGLDAVKTKVSRHGGHVALSTVAGRGTCLTLRVPHELQELAVHRFRVPGMDVPFAVPATWSIMPATNGARSMDVAAALGLRPPAAEQGQGDGRSLALALDGMRVALAIDGTPEAAVAERLCPTSDEDPVEVVLLRGGEGLLIRPERLRPEHG